MVTFNRTACGINVYVKQLVMTGIVEENFNPSNSYSLWEGRCFGTACRNAVSKKEFCPRNSKKAFFRGRQLIQKNSTLFSNYVPAIITDLFRILWNVNGKHFQYFMCSCCCKPVPVAARSKA